MFTLVARTLAAPLASLALAYACAVGAPAARADDGAPAGAAGDVARLSVVSGRVSVQHGDGAAVTPAVVNAPLLGSDYVTTGEDGRAEIQFDAASALRLGANVQLRFVRLEGGTREIQLAAGTIEVRLFRDAGTTSVDTPSVAVQPRAGGSYRITVDDAGRTLVTVRSGQADVVAAGAARALVPGTTLLAEGLATAPSLRSVDTVAVDAFDRFNDERDAREQRGLADANAPPGVAGIDELGAYGRWVDDASYGTVWTPAVTAPGWAPYRDGRWAWENSYGWTWIGAEPWGWAPYHYGRWFYNRQYGWCWYPARAVIGWSPALVAFIGYGGYRSVGWVPLAPFEPFNPWWAHGRRTLSAGYAGPPARPAYQNALHGGATEVAKQRFLEGRFDARTPVTPERLRGQIARGEPPEAPVGTHARRTAAGDPWTRFGRARGEPEAQPAPAGGTAVTVPAPAVWSRFAPSPVAPSRTPGEPARAATRNGSVVPSYGARAAAPSGASSSQPGLVRTIAPPPAHVAPPAAPPQTRSYQPPPQLQRAPPPEPRAAPRTEPRPQRASSPHGG